MRTKHPSDDAFEAWVDGADQLRTHSVQAAFRQGWNEQTEVAEAWWGIADRLAFQLADALHILKTQAGISNVRSEHDSAESALADYRKMLPADKQQAITERGMVVPMIRGPQR